MAEKKQKMLKWTKINAVKDSGSLKEVEQTRYCTKYGEYVVDDSNFVPMSEQVKRTVEKMGKTFTQETIQNYFDYPNGYQEGKTTKAEGTKNRTVYNKNIAELSAEINAKQKEINEKITEAKEKAAKIAAIEKRLDANNGNSSKKN